MKAHAVTLQLSAPLYDHFETRAERAQRSVEAELLDVVASVAADDEELSPDLARTLADLKLLDDVELRYAAQNRFGEEAKAELETLNEKQGHKGLDAVEKQALERLIHQYDQAVLLRAEALRILKDRGHDVSEFLTAA